MLYYGIALVVVGIDQLTKYLVAAYMELGDSIPLIERVLFLTSHRNRGAAWGILQGQMWLFYIVTTVFLVGIVFFMQREAGKASVPLRVGLAFLLGGAAGNFIDRLFRKEVVDFIDTYIFTYDFPIFNVADAALWVGIAFIVIHELVSRKRAKAQM